MICTNGKMLMEVNRNVSRNISDFMDHGDDGMKPELNMRYSILPSRMTGDKRLKIAHYDVMVCLGCYASPKGLVYMTVQTMERHCPHVRRETIKKAIKDLIKWEYVRKLEPKYIKGQQSKWLTNRYQLLYEKDMEVPPYEELMKEVVSLDRVDDAFKQNDIQDNSSVIPYTYSGTSTEVAHKICKFLEQTVGSVSGQRPNYSINELILYSKAYGRDLPLVKKTDVVVYAQSFLRKHKRNPKLKEVIIGCYL